MTKKLPALESSEISEIIQMALSDHVSFDQIQSQYGLRENEVKKNHENKPKGSFLQSLEKKSSRIFIKTRALQIKCWHLFFLSFHRTGFYKFFIDPR